MGIVLIFFAVPGYVISPNVINTEINQLMGGNTDTRLATSILSQLGIPPIDEMAKIAQYSFVGLGVVGAGVIIFGIISKKYKPQFARSKTESAHHEDLKGESNVLGTLQDRLAKGEITPNQYQKLKRSLEEK